MINWLLFIEFLKIGLFAVGGGPATIPFLFDLTKRYNWFSAEELANMIAVSQSTPGPIGINMATYAGFQAGGILGACISTLSLVLPSVIVVVWISKALRKCANNPMLHEVMFTVRPVVVVLIGMACWELLRISVVDYYTALIWLALCVMIYFYKKSPIFYIVLSAILGIILDV